jgi:hypothetical protein
VGADGPLGYAFEVQATQHAIYFSADDAHVREIWWGLTAAALKCMSTRRRSSV